MTIAGQHNIAAARTAFETKTQSALDGQANATWTFLAARKEGGDSGAYEAICNGASPTVEKWIGTKSFGGFRKLRKFIGMDKFHRSMSLLRTSVVYDKGGSTAAGIKRFFDANGDFLDQVVYEHLATNPDCVDGVSLLNTAHPYGANGGTWSNSTTDALSYASFDAGKAAMGKLQDEHGAYMGLSPDVLIVNPDEERTALEIAEADTKPISDGSTGTTSIANVFQGLVKVVVTPRMPSGDWLLLDSRYPVMDLVVWRDPEPVIADDMSGSERMKNDMFLYSVEGDLAAGAVEPYGCYGKIS